MNKTSTPSTPLTSRAASATRRTSSGPISPGTLANPHLDAPEPRGGCPVSHASDLARLALAAVRRTPERPLLAPGDGVARVPELRGDPRVVGVAVHLRELAVLDPPRHLAPELEVHALVVDGP